MLVEPSCGEISIRRQCELLGVSRASWYYEPAGERQENLRLMRYSAGCGNRRLMG